MTSTPPVDFEECAKRARGSAGQYPYSIKASDLMRNFVFATLDLDEKLVENKSGPGGHPQRALKLAPGTARGQLAMWDGDRWVPTADPPTGRGTWVVGYRNGQLGWIETEAC